MNAITTISHSPVGARHPRSLVQYALMAAIAGFIVYTQVDLQPIFAPDQGYHVERIASDPWESPMVPDLNEQWYPMDQSPYGPALNPAPAESMDPPPVPMFSPAPPAGISEPPFYQPMPTQHPMRAQPLNPMSPRDGGFPRTIR